MKQTVSERHQEGLEKKETIPGRGGMPYTSFGMRHETQDVSIRIRNPCDVMNRSVGIVHIPENNLSGRFYFPKFVFGEKVATFLMGDRQGDSRSFWKE